MTACESCGAPVVGETTDEDAPGYWLCDVCAGKGPGTMYQPADPIGEWERRGPGSAEVIEMAAFTVGPYEALCPECHMIHRPGVECP